VLRACAFDLGNTLLDDTRLLKQAVADMGSWLEAESYMPCGRDFETVYLRANQRDNRPFISHTYGEVEFFRESFRELGLAGISPERALAQYRKLLDERLSLEPGVVSFALFQRYFITGLTGGALKC